MQTAATLQDDGPNARLVRDFSRGAVMAPVAVFGTGLLGRGIAEVVARAGFPVILHDANATALEAACESLSRALSPAGARLRTESVLERAARDADVIIEAVVEDLGVKRQVFAGAGQANPSAILMSNSSVLPISRIAALTPHPERAVGTHWWNPPQLIPIVEVIRGPMTSDAVLQRTVAFLQALGKTTVRVERDVPGFVGNRLQHALWREALALVSDGIRPAADVDRIVAVTLGVTLAERGPIADMHHVGLAQAAQELAATLPTINSDSQPAKLLRDKVAQGQLGAKTGKGFLDWSQGARERAAGRLQQHLEKRLRCARDERTPPGIPLPEQDLAIARRLRVALWREALAMIEGGVCTASTIDLVATNTIGLRLAAMGPVENADYVGLDLTLAIHETVLPSLDSRITVPGRLVRAAETGSALE